MFVNKVKDRFGGDAKLCHVVAANIIHKETTKTHIEGAGISVLVGSIPSLQKPRLNAQIEATVKSPLELGVVTACFFKQGKLTGLEIEVRFEEETSDRYSTLILVVLKLSRKGKVALRGSQQLNQTCEGKHRQPISR